MLLYCIFLLGDFSMSEQMEVQEGDTQAPEMKNEQNEQNAPAQEAQSAIEAELEKMKLEAVIKDKQITALTQLNTAVFTPSTEQVIELEALKDTDPDKWYERKTSLEAEHAQKVAQVQAEAETNARNAAEEAAIENELVKFNSENSGTPMTRDEVELYVPPAVRIQANNGQITLGELLNTAHNYKTKGSVVAVKAVEKTTDLGNVPGGEEHSTPDKDAFIIY